MRSKVVAFLMISLLFLTSCSQAKPDDAVNSFLDNLISGDYEAAAAFTDKDVKDALNINDDFASSDKTVQLILSKISYSIKSSSITGETATVTTEITAPNLTVIVGQVITTALPMAFASAFSEDSNSSQDVMDQLVEQTFISLLSAPDVPMTTTTIDIQLKNDETGWKVIVNDDLSNAITGGAMKAFESFTQTP